MRAILIASVISFTLLLSINFYCQTQMSQLEGTVRNSEGKPIKDVTILRLGKSDENGHFLLRYDFLRYWKAILFIAPGYKPKAVPIDLDKPKFDVVLELEEELKTYKFPKCGDSVPNGFRRIGQYLKLTVPKRYKFKTGIDTDYRYFIVGVGNEGHRHWMRGGFGPMYANSYPSGDDVLELSIYSYRKTTTGTDWRGVTKNGQYWRYLGSGRPFETYSYKTDSKNAADAFDTILDSACLDDSNLPS